MVMGQVMASRSQSLWVFTRVFLCQQNAGRAFRHNYSVSAAGKFSLASEAAALDRGNRPENGAGYTECATVMVSDPCEQAGGSA